MRYLSLFTGIGGFELGIGEEDECIGYSEIDKYAIETYQKHFPSHTNYGDITKINADAIPDIDCIVGGFPCQSFSVAGKRGGVDDARGTLFFDIARIAEAKRPRLLLLENVKGLLSSGHRNTGIFYDAGAKTYRTERGADSDIELKISVRGETFFKIQDTLAQLDYMGQSGVVNSKDFGVPQNRERIFIVGHLRGTSRPEVFPLLGTDSQDTQALGDDEPGTQGIATLHLGRNGGLKSAIASTLQVAEVPHIVQINQPKHSNDRVYDPEGISPTLNTMQRGNRQPFIQVPEATKQGYAEATVGDSINLSVPNSKTRRGRVGKGIAQTLDTGMQQYTISRTVRSGGRSSPHGSKQNWDSYEVEGRIRRLTPTECERLQGFPDGWTEGVSDSQRYKMLGNAVTVNVIRAILERLNPQP